MKTRLARSASTAVGGIRQWGTALGGIAMHAQRIKYRNLLFAVAVSIPLSAAFLSARADDKAEAKAVIYDVDADAGRVYVKVGTATRFGHEHGVQGNFKSGTVTLGGDGDLVFDMASFTADTAAARERVGLEKKKVSENEAKKVTEAMRGADVLDVEQHPTATFRIGSVTPLDKQAAGEPGMYQVDGRFTLHGAEQKVAFKVKVERGDKEGRIKMTGTFSIKQSDYGIKPYSAAGGLAKVADELEITGDLVLKPKAGK
jgi:polyisoprenoid-binding protein YceI